LWGGGGVWVFFWTSSIAFLLSRRRRSRDLPSEQPFLFVSLFCCAALARLLRDEHSCAGTCIFNYCIASFFLDLEILEPRRPFLKSQLLWTRPRFLPRRPTLDFVLFGSSGNLPGDFLSPHYEGRCCFRAGIGRFDTALSVFFYPGANKTERTSYIPHFLRPFARRASMEGGIYFAGSRPTPSSVV